jgi:hypothetical protein
MKGRKKILYTERITQYVKESKKILYTEQITQYIKGRTKILYTEQVTQYVKERTKIRSLTRCTMYFDIFPDGMEKTLNTTVRIIGFRVEIWTRNSPKIITQPQYSTIPFVNLTLWW